jgi:hypothetical protein
MDEACTHLFSRAFSGCAGHVDRRHQAQFGHRCDPVAWTHRGVVVATGKKAVIVTTILVMMAYFGGRIEVRRMAAARVAALVKQNPEIEQWAVLPRGLGSRLWEVTAASKTRVWKMRICGVQCPESETDMRLVLESDPPSEVVARASTTESAATLLEAARFPVTRVEELPSGYRVTFIEARFYRAGSPSAVAAVITLDKSLQVVSESISLDQRINYRPF